MINQNELTSTNHTVRLDKLLLKAKIDKSQLDSVFDSFGKGFYPDNTYRYNLKINESIFLHMLPLDMNYLNKCNIVLSFNATFFNHYNLPHVVSDLLHSINFSVRAMHVAFDFDTSKQDSLALKYHGNQKSVFIENESYYNGSENSNCYSINYDRNAKEESYGTNITHLHSNRYEFRFTFKLGEQLIHNLNHELITNRLDRFIFIQDINLLHCGNPFKKLLYKLKNDNDLLKVFYPKQRERDKVKAYIKSNRVDFTSLYNQSIHSIYSFLEPSNEFIDDTTPTPGIDLALLSTLDIDSAAVIDELL